MSLAFTGWDMENLLLVNRTESCYITVFYLSELDFNRPFYRIRPLKFVESFNTIEHNICIFYMQKPF